MQRMSSALQRQSCLLHRQSSPVHRQSSPVFCTASPVFCTTDERAWAQVRLPCRQGGLGIRDPLLVGVASRLAGLVQCSNLAVSLGADPSFVAISSHEASAASTSSGRPAVEHTKDLRRQLCEVAYTQFFLSISGPASPAEQTRLAPHVTAWICNSSPCFQLTATQYKYALRWILGVPFRISSYTCHGARL